MEQNKGLRRRELAVEEESRALDFLLEKVKGKSRNAVKNLLTHRQVLVDGVVVTRHDTPLLPGQRVVILPPGAPAPADLPFPICYEDDWLLAIEKPAGLLAVASDAERQRTAYRMVLEHQRAKDEGAQLHVVHRLDQDTSGLLLFAKSREIREQLQKDWETAVQERVYAAVVSGAPKEREGVVRSFLKETKTHLVYSTGDPRGKEAITEYQVKKSANGYSLLELYLHTGRKNQIRVHMKDLGCPVVGDRKYGGEKSPIGRLCLHAGRLTFTHPVTGETVSLTSRRPRDFNRLFREAEG